MWPPSEPFRSWGILPSEACRSAPGRNQTPRDPFSPPLRPQEGDINPGSGGFSLLSTPSQSPSAPPHGDKSWDLALKPTR